MDIRADVYALGGTMLWALTGRSPFQSRGNVSDLLNQRRAQAGPSVEIGPEVPTGLPTEHDGFFFGLFEKV